MSSILADQAHRRRIGLLAGIALVSVLLWQTQVGGFILYPFTILATWFHEMGHGVAVMLTGSEFDSLVIYADGSGYARSLRPVDSSRLASALIAASGPLGPAVAGSALIVASRSEKATQAALAVVGAALILSTLIWVRSFIGWLILPALGAAILALAWRGTAGQQRFGIQLLGVQACISTWHQFGYLFSDGGSVGGEVQRSDTAAIADALLLPYWFWGAGISVLIIAMVGASFAVAFRR